MTAQWQQAMRRGVPQTPLFHVIAPLDWRYAPAVELPVVVKLWHEYDVFLPYVVDPWRTSEESVSGTP